MKYVHIINYGSGNLFSLLKAFEYIGVKPKLINSAEDFVDVRKLVLPGVGAFGNAKKLLLKNNMISCIEDYVDQSDGMVLGICLGFQLLCSSSDEAPGIKGLNFLPGHCSKNENEIGPTISTNVGFRKVTFDPRHPLMADLESGSYFYFTHSYSLKSSIALEVNEMQSFDRSGNKFIAGATFGNIMGVQFHPEKSQANGLKLLRNFMSL